MKNNRKDKNIQYSCPKQIRFTKQVSELIEAKALEQHTTESEIIRQSVAEYMNRSMSDTEIVHASLAEVSRKIRYLENKVELLALVLFEQTKFLMRVMPSRQTNSDELVEKDFKRFISGCTKSLRQNHGGMLESMILDAYEQSGTDEKEGKDGEY